MIAARRLEAGDEKLAVQLFGVMAEVFDEDPITLSDAYVERLLQRSDFWAIAAFAGDDIAGGVTAHALPMTRSEASEIFIYDVAVRERYQRMGVGRLMMATLRAAAAEAGVSEMFVPADNEDTHALDFYRALGGVPAPVTFFTFAGAPVPGVPG